MASIVSRLVLVTAAIVFAVGCKQKTPAQDRVFVHTPENTHQKIQELRLQLAEALQQKNLQYVHDNMFYFKGLLESLSAGLEGEKKQRLDEVLRELIVISEEIDNSAGRGNQAATEANMEKLISKLKTLEMEFKTGKK
jgi:hypothetical protein